MECLEDGRSVVSLLSVDFSKAFNRMCHRVCLQELSTRRASSESLKIIATFLHERKMRIKVRSTLSSLRLVRGGSPQGTWLGNYLFTVTIEAIEERNGTISKSLPPVVNDYRRSQPPRAGRPPRFATLPVERFHSNKFTMRSTPIKKTKGTLRYHDESGRSEPHSAIDFVIPEQPSRSLAESCSVKYVDDLTILQHHYLPSATSHFTTQRERKNVEADECEEAFETILRNACNIGMKVNESKTQLLCLSINNHCEVISSIVAGDSEVFSQQTMKILGFVMDSRASMSAHVRHIQKKVDARLWIFVHLKRVSLAHEILTTIYSSMIQPIIEYACQAYSYQLTITQSVMWPQI